MIGDRVRNSTNYLEILLNEEVVEWKFLASKNTSNLSIHKGNVQNHSNITETKQATNSGKVL